MRDQRCLVQSDRRLLDRLEHESDARRPGVAFDDRGQAAPGLRAAFRPRVSISGQEVCRTLTNNGLLGSMGRVGACADNAAMESFFALPQKNVLDRQRWRTRADLRLAIVTWIERTYHRKRRQRRLGTLTPLEFETINRTAAAA